MDQQIFEKAQELKTKISNTDYLIQQVDEVIEQFDWKLHENISSGESKYVMKIVERNLSTHEEELVKELAFSHSFYDYLQQRKKTLKAQKQELETEFKAL